MPLLHFKSDRPIRGVPTDGDRVREKIFLEHYAALNDRALRFTHGQRERAEDLVHDTFVQLVVKQVDVEKIEDVRAYLHGILRNLYLLQVRRATRFPVHQLSLLDHDSADLGLRAQNSIDQFQSADLLVRACRFVCHRKETSIPASILILRFYHGFYTDEICQIAGSQRRQVNKWLARGREEAKAFLANPQPLAELKMSTPATPPNSPRAFLVYLRHMIFDSCTTPCEIVEDESNDVAALAHIVSCPICLEGIARRLGIMGVNERMMDDITDGNDGSGKGSSASGDRLRMRSISSSRGRSKPAQRLRRGYRDRMRELFEHHPSELSIVFEGETHATLLLNAPLNTLNLSLEQRHCPDSIAILSEQEVCLLILDRAEIECLDRKTYHVAFSDDRSLEVVVSPEYRGPSLQIAYRDPELATASALVRNRLMVETDERLSLVIEAGRFQHPLAILRRWWNRLSRYLARVPNPPISPALAHAALITATFAVIVMAGVRQQRNEASAAEILAQANAVDPWFETSGQPGVVYQRVNIRTSSRSFERSIYRDAQHKRQAIEPSSTGNEALIRNLASAGISWDLPLSSAGYKNWHDRQPAYRDQLKRVGAHLLELTTTVSGGNVAAQSFTLRDTDFHPVGRTVTFRDSGTVEIAELDYQVLPWDVVRTDLFAPAVTAPAPVVNIAESSTPARLSAAPTLEQLDLSELSARLVLNGLHADTGEQIQLVRDASEIEVRGVVGTEERKAELHAQLKMVPHVKDSIQSVEALDKLPDNDPKLVTASQASVFVQPSPLKQYLSAEAGDVDVVDRLSGELLNVAITVSHESRALVDLLDEFAPKTKLTELSKIMLAELVFSHRSNVLNALRQERDLLKALRGNDAGVAADGLPSMGGSLIGAADRNLNLCEELTMNGSSSSRSAKTIAAELDELVKQLSIRVREARVAAPPANQPAPGRDEQQ